MTRIVRLIAAAVFIGPTPITGQTLRPFGTTAKSDSATTRIAVFADGNIRGVATGGSKESTTGTGSLGIAVSQRRVYYSAQVNIASSVDTVRDQVGTTLLSPGAGHSFQSGFLDVRVWSVLRPFGLELGMHWYGGASKYIWAVDSQATTTVIGQTGLTAFYEITRGKVSDNDVGMSFELGFALRRIGGDIADNDSLRARLLGVRHRTFFGPEAGLQIRFNNITAGIEAYWFFGKNVHGVTNGQIAAGIGIQGDVLKGPLSHD